MKLYYTPGVCSLAPHIVLYETGLDFALERVDPQTKRTSSGQDYRNINANAYVPALEIEPGLVLTEGPAIMQYIADKASAYDLAPRAGSLERYQLISWLNFITSEIHKGFSPLFKPGMPPEAKDMFREQLATRLDYLECHLKEHDYLLGERFSIADAYLYVSSGWAEFVDLSLEPWPAIRSYRERIGRRDSVRAALQARA